MSAENYTHTKIPETGQRTSLEGSSNPGAYRSAERDNRLRGVPLPTRAFVQKAFAEGAGERLDDRRKWLLVRYIIDDEITFQELATYAGVARSQRANKLHHRTLTLLWNASPKHIQEKFPKLEILRGKPRVNTYGRHLPPDIKAKISEAGKGRKHSENTRAKMSAVHRAKSLSDEEILTIVMSRPELWRQIRETREKAREQDVLQPTKKLP